MACYHPLKAYRSREIGKNGKRKIVFNIRQGFRDLQVIVPCGQCVGCRLERSRQWAIRCAHEASLYKENSFITLTYDDNNLPTDGSLNLRHFQLFMKRLRKKYGPKIRFYHCGEYGDLHRRPHYHACLFNHGFEDKKQWSVRNNIPIHISDELQDLWGQGFTTVGEVNFQSAAYVARYIMKKRFGDIAEEHYEKINPSTGEITQLKPEYTTMSRRPGIGAEWLKKFKTDVYAGDFVVMNGKKMRPPRYYDGQYEITTPEEMRKIKSSRMRNAKKHAWNNTPDRLRVREKIQDVRLTQLPRNIKGQ